MGIYLKIDKVKITQISEEEFFINKKLTSTKIRTLAE